ncbi:hypothetical protein CSOJ01_08419 [Colletotrichum sojae]|uniref:Uncharacterized protein n=1 Tax=Colletotrichum sojae TaxID=2175907 RepID=A0A8H6J5T1_9PEZI|nr:hypothetical protein CSOJ01_08419 [Colletotrichum sojae]
MDSFGLNSLGGTGEDLPQASSTDNNDLLLLTDPDNFDFSAGHSCAQQLFPVSGMEFVELGQANNTQATSVFEQSSVLDLEPQLRDFGVSHSSLPLEFDVALQTSEYPFESTSWPQTDTIASSEVLNAAGDFSSVPSDSGARSDDNRIPSTPPDIIPGLESRELSSNNTCGLTTGYIHVTGLGVAKDFVHREIFDGIANLPTKRLSLSASGVQLRLEVAVATISRDT